MTSAITNATIFTGDGVIEAKNILIKNGRISDISDTIPGDAEIIDLGGKNIAPGFIDIQLNGGYNLYFSQDPGEAALEDMYKASCDFGTSYILPTLISSPNPVILKAIEAVKNFRERHNGVLGMHLEGPFINPVKRGAHHEGIIRKPKDDELRAIIRQGRNLIKVMTIAPECFTDYQLDMLLDTDIVLSAGHSAMNYAQAQHYFSKGIDLVTHLYNAMTPMGHRECGMVGAVFDHDDVYAPIILDGGHCSYAAARIAYRQKRDKLILISDASFLGRKKKSFDGELISMKMVDGYYRDPNGSLAGAAISIPEAMANTVNHLHVDLKEAVEMATARVARAIKMKYEIGFIKPGYPARFTVFDNELTEYEVLDFL